MRKQYDFSDICVACGAPTAPGTQICWSCQRREKELAESEGNVTERNGTKKKPFREILREFLLEKPG